MSASGCGPSVGTRARKRALLRLAFGSLQIMGASAGLYLLLDTGPSVATGIVVGATLIVSIASRLIFSAATASEPGPEKQQAQIKNT